MSNFVPPPRWNGKPEKPYQSGWFWLNGTPTQWIAPRQVWLILGVEMSPGTVCNERFEGPVLTPSQIAALIEEAKK